MRKFGCPISAASASVEMMAFGSRIGSSLVLLLTELEQNRRGFCHFADCDMSQINRLDVARGRFEAVVMTLGIFLSARFVQMAHVSAPYDSQEGRKDPPLLVSCS